jgi:hypothetical protein
VERVKSLFSSRSQADYLAEVDQAESPSALEDIVMKYVWNLRVLEHALSTLTERFPERACILVDFVGERVWAPASATPEARSAVSHYLFTCLPDALPETRSSLAAASAKLLVDTRGGSNGGLSSTVVRQTLELVDRAVSYKEHSGDRSREPVLSIFDIRATFMASMNALESGHGAACFAMRSLLRAEEEYGLDGSTVVSVRHLETLGSMMAPLGAELCLPSLRTDITARLSLTHLPTNIEGPPSSEEPGSGAPSLGARGNLQNILQASIAGQHCAIRRLAKSPGYVRLKMGGMWTDKPLVLLLTGVSGSGKTQTAMLLAELLLGKPIAQLQGMGRFRKFSMESFSTLEDQKSFFGPPKGIVGVGDLPELLKKWPDAVILLDEIEKAHHSFARALLTVFGEHGSVYDPKTGKAISSAQATFILTSNLAKELISEQTLQSSRSDSDCTAYEALRHDVHKALGKPFIAGRENFFKESEMRGRITDVLPFLPFSSEAVETAVRRFLSAEAKVFKTSSQWSYVSLSWEPQVVPFFTSEYSHSPEEGLRGVHKHVQMKVREVLLHASEAGLLQEHGGLVLRLLPGPPASLDLRVLTAHAQPGTSMSSVRDSDSSPRSDGNGDWLPSLWKLASSFAVTETSHFAPAGNASQHLWEWEKSREWDWSHLKQWLQDTKELLQEFVWEYRFWCIVSLLFITALVVPQVSGSAVIAASTVKSAAPSASAVGMAANTAAAGSHTLAGWGAATAPAAAPVASAAPLLSGVVSLLEFFLPVASTAVTVWGAAQIYQNRYLICAIGILVGMATWLLPPLLKAICQRVFQFICATMCRAVCRKRETAEARRYTCDNEWQSSPRRPYHSSYRRDRQQQMAQRKECLPHVSDDDGFEKQQIRKSEAASCPEAVEEPVEEGCHEADGVVPPSELGKMELGNFTEVDHALSLYASHTFDSACEFTKHCKEESDESEG